MPVKADFGCLPDKLFVYIVWVRSIHTFKCFIRLPANLTGIWYQEGERANSVLRKYYYAREGTKLYNWEKKMLKNVSRCLVVSEKEKQLIADMSGDTITELIPNGADTEYLKPYGSGRDGEPDLMFLGNMDWYPNRDAADYFCETIFPYVKEKYPYLKLFIVGKYSDSNRSKFLNTDGIEITGYVKEVSPYFRKNVILIVPIRIGAGTRIKILEAMACGVPVISTAIGCEGLEVEDGKNILIADGLKEFMDGIIKLIENKVLRKNISEEGRKLVEQKYNWENIIEGLNRIYLEIGQMHQATNNSSCGSNGVTGA